VRSQLHRQDPACKRRGFTSLSGGQWRHTQSELTLCTPCGCIMPLVLSDTFTSDEKVPQQMELCDLVALPAVRWTCDTGHGFNRQRLVNNTVIIRRHTHTHTHRPISRCCDRDSVKAKFHYASWFGAGSEPVRNYSSELVRSQL